MLAAIADQTYHYEEIHPNDFYFRTRHNNVYNVGFMKHWQNDVMPLYTGLKFNLYEVYFEIVELKQQMADRRIAFTTVKIIDDFMQQGDRVIFYTALREDGRSKALDKIYDLWFRKFVKGKRSYNYYKRIIDTSDYEEDMYFTCVVNNETLFRSPEEIEETVDTALCEIFPFCSIKRI